MIAYRVFDMGKTGAKFAVATAQGVARVDVQMPGQVDRGKQNITDLAFQIGGFACF